LKSWLERVKAIEESHHRALLPTHYFHRRRLPMLLRHSQSRRGNRLEPTVAAGASKGEPISHSLVADLRHRARSSLRRGQRDRTPLHTHPRQLERARGASRRAAAVQAAYATLVSLFPAQSANFAAVREASLASCQRMSRSASTASRKVKQPCPFDEANAGTSKGSRGTKPHPKGKHDERATREETCGGLSSSLFPSNPGSACFSIA
jgi:hypothetical protein